MWNVATVSAFCEAPAKQHNLYFYFCLHMYIKRIDEIFHQNQKDYNHCQSGETRTDNTSFDKTFL